MNIPEGFDRIMRQIAFGFPFHPSNTVTMVQFEKKIPLLQSGGGVPSRSRTDGTLLFFFVPVCYAYYLKYNQITSVTGLFILWSLVIHD